MKYIVKENTFPEYPGVPHAKPGDIVEWKPWDKRNASLIRVEDSKSVFCVRVDSGNFRKTGIIAENKSKGQRFIIEPIQEND